jgi:hypothetical protein
LIFWLPIDFSTTAGNQNIISDNFASGAYGINWLTGTSIETFILVFLSRSCSTHSLIKLRTASVINGEGWDLFIWYFVTCLFFMCHLPNFLAGMFRFFCLPRMNSLGQSEIF